MRSDDQQLRNPNSALQGQLTRDFSVALLNTIASVENDPVQFRHLIYDSARARLQKEAWQRDPPMSPLELRRMMLVLETAIERVETECVIRESLPLLAASASAEIVRREPEPAALSDAPIMLVDQRPTQIFAITAALKGANFARTIPLPGPLKAILRMGILAATAAAIVLVVDREFHLLTPAPVAIASAARTSSPTRPPTAASSSAPLTTIGAATASARRLLPAAQSGPLPAVYGIYAVSDGKLFELEPLMGRVPDPRIFMSAVINKPSQTHLPDGRVTFIVYRREIASSAPDHVTVRVIAKVMRDLKFSKTGHPMTVKVDDAWAMRNVSFDYQVAPSPDSREMILIKPENDAFTLPPGRYGLVFNGLAYDFVVDGRVNKPVQCLERTEAANGTFYSECRAL